MSDAVSRNDRHIAIWLLCLCGAVFVMLVIGGATRLTHSGLSMVEWDPLMGWIPPLTEAAWQATFEKYQRTPEFQQLNPGMTVEGFKNIFMLEYVHRVWGRLIGLFFLVPFLYFLVRGKIRKGLMPRLLFMFVLGGLQGLLGWYMVKSGLVDNPFVSQYRLTAHLLAAFVIYAYILWVALGLLYPRPLHFLTDVGSLRRLTLALALLVFVTAGSGGLVAGLKAGFAYNTFPLMEGRLVPEGALMLEPWYRNFFENIATVQFDHRTLAEFLVLCIVGLWLYARRFGLEGRARRAFHLLLAMGLVQFSLGVATLVHVVPTGLAVAHQGGALILFTLALFALHALRRGTHRM